MIKYTFKCKVCDTIMTIETSLDESSIHKVPPCPCNYSRMEIIDLKKTGDIEYNRNFETNLGLEEIENLDKCLCLDCIVTHDGL